METPADIRLLTRYSVDRFTVVFPQKLNQVLAAIHNAIGSINQSPSPKVRKEHDILIDDTGTDERMEIEMHNIYCTIYDLCERTEQSIKQFISHALTQVALLQLKRAELVDKTVLHLKEGKARFKAPHPPYVRTLQTFIEGFEAAAKAKEEAAKEEAAKEEAAKEEVPKKKQSLHMRRTKTPRPGPKLELETQGQTESQGHP